MDKLDRRFRKLLAGRAGMKTAWVLSAIVCSTLFAIPALGQNMAAQPPAEKPPPALRYDVSSIKLAEETSVRRGMGTRPDGIVIYSSTLKEMVVFAYGLIRAEGIIPVSGGAAWAATKKFDVQAKMDPETLAAFQSLSLPDRERQRRLMLQALLAERFKVKAHAEERESPVYGLIVDKTGIKLKQDTLEGELKANSAPKGSMGATENSVEGVAISLTQVVLLLNNHGHLDRLVVDQTHDTKLYDLLIQWNAGSDPNLPTLFTALEEQAGLKLVRTMAPVTYVVLDFAVEPSPN